MRNQKKSIRWIIAIVLLLASVLPAAAQKLTVESMEVAPFDLTAASKPVYDYNNVACGLVKVFLAADGAEFGGNIIKPVKREVSQYLVYMTAGSKMLNIQCPGYIPLMVNFRDYGIQRIESQQTYVLTLLMPGTTNAPVDDGMRYLVLHVKPENATVFVDDKLQSVVNGTVSVRLPRGNHSYRVVAVGYSPKADTVEIAEGRKTVDIALESAQAQVTVSCPTPGAQIYVNDGLVGTAPWSGQLVAGNYLIEGRLEGYKSQQQSVTLAENENCTIELPELNAIIGNLEVNYQPADAEVWIDGKKVGVSPDIFRNIMIGSHDVEIRATGYKTTKQAVTISEGKTEQISGELTAVSNTGIPVPEAVDLGLSVKWASFNLGASKPEENGNQYKWGEIEPSSYTNGWKYYRFFEETRKRDNWSYNSFYKYDFQDGKKVLDSEDDAATVNLGGSWRMPTKDEIKELIDKCEHKRTEVNGVIGIQVIGPNDNSIFLPAAGGSFWVEAGDGYNSHHEVGEYGYYWTSSKANGSDDDAYDLYFHIIKDKKIIKKKKTDISWELDDARRWSVLSIRPVFAE